MNVHLGFLTPNFISLGLRQRRQHLSRLQRILRGKTGMYCMVYLDILLKKSLCSFSRTATRVPSSGPRSPERTPAASAAETETPAASVPGKKTDVSFPPRIAFFVQTPHRSADQSLYIVFFLSQRASLSAASVARRPTPASRTATATAARFLPRPRTGSAWRRRPPRRLEKNHQPQRLSQNASARLTRKLFSFSFCQCFFSFEGTSKKSEKQCLPIKKF